MPTIIDPMGRTVIVSGTQEDADNVKKFLEARYSFVIAYAESKGWGSDVNALSIPQILEIRAQDGWKNPLGAGDAN